MLPRVGQTVVFTVKKNQVPGIVSAVHEDEGTITAVPITITPTGEALTGSYGFEDGQYHYIGEKAVY